MSGATRTTGRRRTVGLATALVVIAATLVVASCTARATGAPGRHVPIAPGPCGTRARSCALPYPSMEWLRVDRSSPTGYHSQLAPGLVPQALLAQLGPGATLDDVLDEADGFSPLTPIVFELPAPVDPASVPRDGGDVVKVFDLATGARVPIRAEVSKYATEDFASPTIVLAWPVTRYAYATRYFAGVTDRIRAANGGTYALETPGRDGDGAAPGTRASDLWTRLQAATVDAPGGAERYVQTTSFVTRSEANVTGGVDRMAAIVRAQDHPIKDIQVGPTLLGGVAQVTGKVRVTDFRDAHGVIPRTDDPVGHDLWIDFTMVLPDHGATTAGAPVVIYGHGLSVFKETELVVAAENARHGMATIGIDVPDHGSRAWIDGFLFDLANSRDLGRLLSMPLQGVLDEVSLLSAIKHHFSSLDALPFNWLANTWGDGVPELDTSHVYYQGTSMGGVLGLTFLALAPEVEAAFLQVPGAGILDVIFHSILWQQFKGVTPNGSSVGDAHALVGGAHMLVDRADGTFYLDRIRRQGTPVYLAYGQNDGVVPNADTDRIIALLGLPVVGPQATPSLPGIVSRQVARMPSSGSGAQQIPTSYLDGNVLKPLLTHIAFARPEAMDALARWLDGRVAALGSK